MQLTFIGLLSTVIAIYRCIDVTSIVPSIVTMLENRLVGLNLFLSIPLWVTSFDDFVETRFNIESTKEFSCEMDICRLGHCSVPFTMTTMVIMAKVDEARFRNRRNGLTGLRSTLG